MENKTGLQFYYNYLLSNQPPEFENYPKLLQKLEVRKAIHVGNLTYDDISLTVHEFLNDDIPKTIKPWLEELLEHYKVNLYNNKFWKPKFCEVNKQKSQKRLSAIMQDWCML